MAFLKWRNCHIAWCAPGSDPHDAGMQLLAELYRRETGENMPTVCRRSQGKPYFENSAWHFSISHTKNRVFCCLSRENVGIDAEETDRIAKPVLLSASETARLSASKNPQKDFLRLWVLKESYAKLTGRGIGSYLKETNFSPDDPRVTEIDGCFVAVLTEKDESYAF